MKISRWFSLFFRRRGLTLLLPPTDDARTADHCRDHLNAVCLYLTPFFTTSAGAQSALSGRLVLFWRDFKISNGARFARQRAHRGWRASYFYLTLGR